MWRFTSQNAYCITVQFISVMYSENMSRLNSPQMVTLSYTPMPSLVGMAPTNFSSSNMMESYYLNKDCSKSMANLKTPQIIKKMETLTNDKLYWGNSFAVHLPDACKPNVSLQFAYQSTGQSIQDGTHTNRVQFMLMVTCHLTCVQKMLPNNKKPKSIFNKTQGFGHSDNNEDNDKDEDGFRGNNDTTNNMVEN